MTRITIDKLAQLALELETPAALAAHLQTTEEAAERMLSLVDEKVRGKRQALAERRAAEAQRESFEATLSADNLPSYNPAEEAQDWSTRKEKANMMDVSINLLAAMLRSGQHYLTAEMAAQRRRELGLDMQLL